MEESILFSFLDIFLTGNFTYSIDAFTDIRTNFIGFLLWTEDQKFSKDQPDLQHKIRTAKAPNIMNEQPPVSCISVEQDSHCWSTATMFWKPT